MRGCVQSPARRVFDHSAYVCLEKETLCKPNTVQASRHGGQPRASISRMHALVALVLLAVLFVAAAPRASNATSLHVWTSTYWADQICTHEGSESICAFCPGDGNCFKLLPIKGKNFTPHGLVSILWRVYRGTRWSVVNWSMLALIAHVPPRWIMSR